MRDFFFRGGCDFREEESAFQKRAEVNRGKGEKKRDSGGVFPGRYFWWRFFLGGPQSRGADFFLG